MSSYRTIQFDESNESGFLKKLSAKKVIAVVFAIAVVAVVAVAATHKQNNEVAATVSVVEQGNDLTMNDKDSLVKQMKKMHSIINQRADERMAAIMPDVTVHVPKRMIRDSFHASEYMNMALDIVTSRFLPNPKNNRRHKKTITRHQLVVAAKLCLHAERMIDHALTFLLTKKSSKKFHDKHTIRRLQDLLRVEQYIDTANNRLLPPILRIKGSLSRVGLVRAQRDLEAGRHLLDDAIDAMMKL